MRWEIQTPDESVRWHDATLEYAEGVPSPPEFEDPVETQWKQYYGATFNPARIKLGMMKREMPPRFWKTMPETAIIEELLEEVPERLK